MDNTLQIEPNKAKSTTQKSLETTFIWRIRVIKKPAAPCGAGGCRLFTLFQAYKPLSFRQLFEVEFPALLQQGGGIQAIGTLGPAFPAVEAGLGLTHLLPNLRRVPEYGGHTAHHRNDPGTEADLDARRTGHTVAAAAAELAHQLGPVLFDDRLELLRHGGRLFDAGEELIQLPLMLDAPDGHHAGLALHIGGSGEAVSDEAAGHPLHGDKAHPGFGAAIHQLLLLGAGEVVNTPPPVAHRDRSN